MNYILSPEFHKNIWLSFSRFKLAAPAILAAVLLATVSGPDMSAKQTAVVIGCVLTVYNVILILWGCHEAAKAATEEFTGNTWDFQKMSPLSPWHLGFGKLLGATSYVWYWALFALGVAVYFLGHDLTGQRIEVLGPGFIGDFGPAALLKFSFCVAFSALFGQSIAFLLALQGMSRVARTDRKPRTSIIAVTIMGCLAAIWMAAYTHQKETSYYTLVNRMSEWYGMTFPPEYIKVAVCGFLFYWVIVGIYRSFQDELMYRLRPVAWLAFVASVSLFYAGFLGPERVSMALIVIPLALTYCMVLLDDRNVAKYPLLLEFVRQRDWRRASETLPKWLASLAFVLAAYIVVLPYEAFAGKSGEYAGFFALTVSVLLFFARDAIVLHFINARPGERFITFKICFYYVMAYFALPALCASIITNGKKDYIDALADQAGFWSAFFPSARTDVVAALSPVLLEIVAAAALLSWRVRKQQNAPRTQ